jgi:hypothetical protein
MDHLSPPMVAEPGPAFPRNAPSHDIDRLVVIPNDRDYNRLNDQFSFQSFLGPVTAYK